MSRKRNVSSSVRTRHGGPDSDLRDTWIILAPSLRHSRMTPHQAQAFVVQLAFAATAKDMSLAEMRQGTKQLFDQGGRISANQGRSLDAAYARYCARDQGQPASPPPVSAGSVPAVTPPATGSGAGGITCSVLGLAIISLAIFIAASRKKQLRAAYSAYRGSLTNLKSDPGNADLKERTLALGRAYSNLTRKRRGVTLFDEVALMNDINAACAGPPRGAQKPSNEQSTPEERLNRLLTMKAAGLITDVEYENQKSRILGEI